MINTDRPKVGDRVSVMVVGCYQRFGVVIETDYHPFGTDDSVKIKFDPEPITKQPEWWSLRWVMKENKHAK